jgi:hypothetical protein
MPPTLRISLTPSTCKSHFLSRNKKVRSILIQGERLQEEGLKDQDGGEHSSFKTFKKLQVNPRTPTTDAKVRLNSLPSEHPQQEHKSLSHLHAEELLHGEMD